MKGTREPLLLIATGAFLAAFPIPLLGMIAGAGLALGAHDLRRTDAGRSVPLSRFATIVSGWGLCFLGAATTASPGFGTLYFFFLSLALLASATLVARMASEAGHEPFALQFALPRIGFVAFLPLLFVFHSMVVSFVELLVASIWFAVLVLALRSKALPYGRRRLGRAS
jgi:hypothetical protein